MEEKIKNKGLLLFFTILCFFYVPCAQARLSAEKLESIIEKYNNQVPLVVEQSTLPMLLRGPCYQSERGGLIDSMEVFLYPKGDQLLFFGTLRYGDFTDNNRNYTLEGAEDKFIRSENRKNQPERIGVRTEKGGMEWKFKTEALILTYELFQDTGGNTFLKYEKRGMAAPEHFFCEFVEYIDFSTVN